MKILLAVVLVLGTINSAFSEIVKTPSDITLMNGTVLRKCTVTRWEKDQVVIKYIGGIAPIKFIHMAPNSKEEFQKILTQKFECDGSLYVVTRGAGSYKLGNELIRVFVTQGRNEVTTRTDADGKFKFEWIGPENFTIRVVASRMSGGSSEVYGWELKRETFSDLKQIVLSNHNMTN